jgi:hypothetical protein
VTGQTPAAREVNRHHAGTHSGVEEARLEESNPYHLPPAVVRANLPGFTGNIWHRSSDAKLNA